MSGDGVATAARTRMRPFHYVESQPVMLQKVQVHGSEVGQWMTQIPHHRDGFQEYFRQYHSRSDVEIHSPAVKAPDQRAQQAEIAVRGLADRGPVRSRMHMRRVGADGCVYRDRH